MILFFHLSGACPIVLITDIDAPEAWNLSTGSRDEIVAVIDTGVAYDHEDLAANMWADSNGYHG
jgi:subtilisin family serine protease